MDNKHNSNGSAAVDFKNESDVQWVVLVNTTNTDTKEWVLDFECTFHMWPIKDWFTEVVELNVGQV